MNFYEKLKMDILTADDVRTPDSELTIEQLIKNIKSGDCYIECGAHIGLIALPVIYYTRPKLSILIEPSEYARVLLGKYLNENNLNENVVVIDGMILDYNGEAPFYKTISSPHGSAFPIHREGTEMKKVFKLERIIRDYKIDGDVVMKSDTEGGDPSVWRGLGEEVRKVRFAILEFLPNFLHDINENQDFFLDKIKSDGFSIQTLRNQQFLLSDAPPYQLSDKSSKVDLVLRRQ